MLDLAMDIPMLVDMALAMLDMLDMPLTLMGMLATLMPGENKLLTRSAYCSKNNIYNHNRIKKGYEFQ